MQNLEQKHYSPEIREFLPSNMQLRFFEYENSKELKESLVEKDALLNGWFHDVSPRDHINNYHSYCSYDLFSISYFYLSQRN